MAKERKKAVAVPIISSIHTIETGISNLAIEPTNRNGNLQLESNRKHDTKIACDYTQILKAVFTIYLINLWFMDRSFPFTPHYKNATDREGFGLGRWRRFQAPRFEHGGRLWRLQARMGMTGSTLRDGGRTTMGDSGGGGRLEGMDSGAEQHGRNRGSWGKGGGGRIWGELGSHFCIPRTRLINQTTGRSREASRTRLGILFHCDLLRKLLFFCYIFLNTANSFYLCF